MVLVSTAYIFSISSILNLLFSFFDVFEPSELFLFECLLLLLRPEACLFNPDLALLAELFLCESLELARADDLFEPDLDERLRFLPQVSPKSVFTTSLSTTGLLPVTRPIADSFLVLLFDFDNEDFYESYPAFDIIALY